ncbi:MAG TPA: sigma-70 family RNA polymerase sigma factor [Propionibacteriaceae bacterium]|nr:sigma-70 family RNA polymerase sigma factor [Propionibacteriaceae bacterium]
MTVRPLELEHLLRTEAPQVLGALVRRFGHFDIAEDAVQDALLAAAQQWPSTGIPDHPRGWLIRVGYRRMVDQLRADQARQRREYQVANQPILGPQAEADADDSLTLIFLCCHPVLSPISQVALTLRAVGGLTTSEIAHAYGVTEVAMAQRITRAKQQIKAAGARFVLPSTEDRDDRLAAVLQVLYLIFNEGYAATAGERLHRVDLTTEAIRLTRMLHRLLPDEPEVTGLLALMLLTDARRAARTDAAGNLMTLEHQDRGQWDSALTAEGTALITDAMRRRQVGPYQLQAAIAALHNGAASYSETDWPQIATLYAWLERLAPTPPIRLSRVVAVAMAYGPRRGLALLDSLPDDPLTRQRERAVRAHLLELSGDNQHAIAVYREAATLTRNLPERRYLEHRAQALIDKT